jgi:hypothetical protein
MVLATCWFEARGRRVLAGQKALERDLRLASQRRTSLFTTLAPKALLVPSSGGSVEYVGALSYKGD